MGNQQVSTESHDPLTWRASPGTTRWGRSLFPEHSFDKVRGGLEMRKGNVLLCLTDREVHGMPQNAVGSWRPTTQEA